MQNNKQLNKYMFVMEYADGGTLRDYLKKNFDILTWNDSLNLALQLACAVSRLHDEGIVHLDLVIQFYSYYRYFYIVYH
jgi:serine/threonine protein kinase